MSLYFGTPQTEGISAPIKLTPKPLRAEGNLTYREFIQLIKFLWENVHPDIPIHPVQGQQYAGDAVIVYSLDNRRASASESKKRYRESISVDENKSTVVRAQKFDNYIAFSAITSNDPYLAESIIEEFEEFMDEYVDIMKRRGATEVLYSRRYSDREETRVGEDACVRTVVYMVILERLTRVDYDKIKEISATINLTPVPPLGVNSAWVPVTGAMTEAPDSSYLSNDFVANNQIVYLGPDIIKVGNAIQVFRPFDDQAEKRFPSNVWTPGSSEYTSPALPGGLVSARTYDVIEVDDNNVIKIADNGSEVDITSPGWMQILPAGRDSFTTDIEDNFHTAT